MNVNVREEKNGSCAIWLEMFDSIQMIFQNVSYPATYLRRRIYKHTHTHRKRETEVITIGKICFEKSALVKSAKMCLQKFNALRTVRQKCPNPTHQVPSDIQPTRCPLISNPPGALGYPTHQVPSDIQPTRCPWISNPPGVLGDSTHQMPTDALTSELK